MVSTVVVIIDEGRNLSFEIAPQEVVFEQDAAPADGASARRSGGERNEDELAAEHASRATTVKSGVVVHRASRSRSIYRASAS